LVLEYVCTFVVSLLVDVCLVKKCNGVPCSIDAGSTA